MQKRLFARPLALAVLAAAAIAAGAPATTAAAQLDDPAVTRLAATLDAILANSQLTGASAAVTVRDVTTGETLYNRNGDRRLIPASNTKLLTSTAALEILGPGYRFTTDLRTTGTRSGSTLQGDIYLRGEGDPTMREADYDALATALAASGITTVTGNLNADDTWFDSVRMGREWVWEDEPFYYAAPISALTVAANSDFDTAAVNVTVTPTAAGGRPTVTLSPDTGVVLVENQAVTTAGGGNTISIDRPHGTNRIVVTGGIPAGGAAAGDLMSVTEPTGFAADLFRRALARHGVQLRGFTRLGVATPATAQTLAQHSSMTLGELMVPFLKLSNNGHAEILTKAIGRKVSNQGTWAAGLSAIASFLGTMGMDTALQRQADGSGLSRWNMIPSNEFVDLLAAARAKPWFNTWYAALPVAGNADRMVGGTLRSRMAGTAAANNVHAKTGSMTSVSALSGYATDANGHVLVFSVLLNNHLASSVKSIEDQVAVTLASFNRNAAAANARVAPPAVPQAPAVPNGLECSWVKPIVC